MSDHNHCNPYHCKTNAELVTLGVEALDHYAGALETYRDAILTISLQGVADGSEHAIEAANRVKGERRKARQPLDDLREELEARGFSASADAELPANVSDVLRDLRALHFQCTEILADHCTPLDDTFLEEVDRYVEGCPESMALYSHCEDIERAANNQVMALPEVDGLIEAARDSVDSPSSASATCGRAPTGDAEASVAESR